MFIKLLGKRHPTVLPAAYGSERQVHQNRDSTMNEKDTMPPLASGDEPLCNLSDNPAFERILGARLDRRNVLLGSLAAAVAGYFGPSVLGLTSPSAQAAAPAGLLGFAAIKTSRADTVMVPPGYRAQVILPWGEPLTGSYPAYSLDASGADQEMQVGSHHDGMHFFPIEGEGPYKGSSADGLLVINHEYVEPRFMHAAAVGTDADLDAVPTTEGLRAADQVLKEMNGHGVTIARIRKGNDGNWALKSDPRNRRITALTPMEISGPVRGSRFVKTKFSPEGTMTRGTLNNCAHGVTPWNTYLAAEENWAGYFRNGEREDQKPNLPREHSRYGVKNGWSRYGWELADTSADEFVRFDASSKGASAEEDYRNEPNTFGWIVEIDPFDPESTPVKRTALGRFAHEGVVFGPVAENRPVVCYSGDDARFEYIYKFVSAEPYSAEAGGHLLDEGTLYVARFHDDGSGEWLPLVHGQNGLTPENGFASQADVLVNTRTAADFVGATKMDRPEWGAIDPKTGMVYFTLTNNSRRILAETDAANPRAVNEFGHIIRWTEAGDDHAATRFAWDIFIFAGNRAESRDPSGRSLTEDNIFSSPDGLWFDRDGRLWIQTDVSNSVQNKGNHKIFGNNQMLAADPVRGEIRRFLTGPIGQEITGAVTTPDGKTMFVNVQHPGATTTARNFAAGNLDSHWPDGGDAYPRSATVVITKEDGGVIGT
jgi:uncharacterized protein